ncbi:unannotated protein [freshwater metagenome]|uniref:Unannotated protein n=1 Tax=freshwater metagenome TaxID=449393 RepID=A0A6J7E7B5_9ZZZZ
MADPLAAPAVKASEMVVALVTLAAPIVGAVGAVAAAARVTVTV